MTTHAATMCVKASTALEEVFVPDKYNVREYGKRE
jgi:hypothetical protein